MSAVRSATPRHATKAGPRKIWSILARLATLIIVIAVGVVLFNLGRKLDWLKVLHASREIGRPTLALAIALVFLGYAVYSSFDLLAKRYARHGLPALKTLGVAALSYAMNLNLGVLVGGIGVRLRLYRKLGVRRSTAARVVLFSTATNWTAYCWLAGILFVSGIIPIPVGWDIGRHLLQGTGAVLLALALGYLAFCGFSPRRNWMLRGHRVDLPSAAMAATQAALGSLSWMIMGAIIYVLLQRSIGYPEVLGILLLCSIAALITHIPGGLGVTEAIFVATLSGRLPEHQVLAALLMYRVLYGLAPLCLALAAYLATELHLRRGHRH